MEEGIVIRSHRPGDPSRVCFFYYKLFETQYRFNGNVERYFIEGMADLFHEPDGSRLWVAEQDGAVVGSIAIIRRGEAEAQLRWFGVDSSAQGKGIGSRLVETAMAFCAERGYTHVTLWTIDILKSARHIYRKHGFAPTETKRNYEWADIPLLEEKWEFYSDN